MCPKYWCVCVKISIKPESQGALVHIERPQMQTVLSLWFNSCQAGLLLHVPLISYPKCVISFIYLIFQ